MRRVCLRFRQPRGRTVGGTLQRIFDQRERLLWVRADQLPCAKHKLFPINAAVNHVQIGEAAGIP